MGYKVPLVIANGFGGQEGKSPRAASATAVPPSEDHCSLMFIRNKEGQALLGGRTVNNVSRPAKVRRIEGFTKTLWKSTSSRYRLPPQVHGHADRTMASPTTTVGIMPIRRASKNKGIRTVRFVLPVVEDN